MTERSFRQKIEELHSDGKLWSAMTSGLSHANTHVDQSAEGALFSIIYRGKEAHSFFRDISVAEQSVYDLMMSDDGRLYRFLQKADVGDKIAITFTNEKAFSIGVVQDCYTGNLELRQGRDVRAVFYRSTDRKDILGLNLDTFYPLTTSEHSKKVDKNLLPILERSGVLHGMCPEEQVYWWTAANSAINLSLNYNGEEFTAEGMEKLTHEENGRPIVKDVMLKMTTAEYDCSIETDDGRKYDLFNDDDLDKFCNDFRNSISGNAAALCGFPFAES